MPKDAIELRSLIRVDAHEGDNRIDIEVSAGFDDGLFQPANIAERTLVEFLVTGVAKAAGEVEDVKKAQCLVAAICPNPQMRYIHRMEAQTFRDYLHPQIRNKPILNDQFDHAACLVGLGWRNRSRELGSEIAGVLDCTSFLNGIVAILIAEICEILRKLDRRSVVAALLYNHEAAACDRDSWRRTTQAVLAIHSDRAAAADVVGRHDSRLGGCFTVSRILLEAAICECPLEGGREPGRLDLTRLISRAQLVFSLGGDSDAVHWGAIEPWIRITPLGDIHMKRLFEKQVYEPFVKFGGAVRIEQDVEKYAELYAARRVPESAVGVIDERFLRAWEAEFGVSVDGMRAFMAELGEFGVAQEQMIVSMPRSRLVEMLAGAGGISAEKALKALSRLVLETRPQWQVPPAEFKSRDWEPWRFRRRLSVLRRPFLQLDHAEDPEITFAPGLVHDAFVAMIGWFHQGDIHQSETESSEMESWFGLVSHENGTKFSRTVEGRLKELGWKTKLEIQITDVLARRHDQQFGDLRKFGDVDVLAWRNDSPRVLIIECKDVQFRKTPGEIAEQLADFRGELRSNGKPDQLRKHLDRLDVLTANREAVAKRLRLAPPIRLEGHLVFRDPVPMKFAWDRMASRIRLSISNELDRL